MKNKCLTLFGGSLLISALTLFGAPWGAPTASAVTQFDGVIKPSTNELIAKNTMISGVCNTPRSDYLQTTWGGFINDTSNYYGSAVTNRDAFIAMFNANLDSGKGWAVVQRFANSPYTNVGGCDMNTGDAWIEISVSDVKTLTFTELYGGQQLQMSGNNYKALIHYSSGDGSLKVTAVYANDRNVQQSALSQDYEQPFLINFDITYPDGYAGNNPPSGVTLPGSTKIEPQFHLKAADRTVTVNFRDADDTKEYVYAWTMLKYTDSGLIADGTVETSGVNEPVSTAEFTVAKRGKYVFGVQMCPVGTQAEDETCEALKGTSATWIDLNINGSPIDLDTGDQATNSDTISNCVTDTLQGTEVTHCTTKSLIDECMKADFPFIDIPACINNIGAVAGILSFSQINLNGKFDATPCKTLGTLDNWMNLNNPTICPQIPSYVRDTVTPFVSIRV